MLSFLAMLSFKCISALYLIWLQWGPNVQINGGSLLLRLASAARLILDQRKLLLVLLLVIALSQEEVDIIES